MNELEIFTEALQHPLGVERAHFLDSACGQDASLRARVERLLVLHDKDNALLDRRPHEMLQNLKEAPESESEEVSSASLFAALLAFLQPGTRPGALGRLGHYEVLEILGHGGYGVVLKAFDEKLLRVVAIKVMSPHLALISPPRKRFLREARAAAQIGHENVVRIYAVEEQPLPHLVMEYIEGQTLQQRLETSGPLEAREVVRLGRQIAQGLAAAHAQGLIHRDIKPANILLEAGPEPRVKLTDFGLARTTDDASLTASGIVAGTPMYMAPEQARGETLDPRADLFSLGSVLYAMCTGRGPFRASATLAVLKRVTEDTPRPIREIIPETPEGLCAVISRLHQKEPADRFASATEVNDALSSCLTDPLAAGRPERPRWKRWVAAAGIGLILVGAGWLVREIAFATPGGGQPLEIVQHDLGKPSPPPPMLPTDVLTVTSILDDDSVGTLRWAVNEANTRSGPDEIHFDPKVFRGPQTITLTQGPLTLRDPDQTTITGPTATVTIAASNTRVIEVERGPLGSAAATLINVTLIGGNLGLGNGTRGSAIFNAGDLFLDGVTIADCIADFGGGICNEGKLRVQGSTFVRNQSANSGGAIMNSGTLTVTNSTFTANRADRGAAIADVGGTTTILNSTITANTTGGSGAVWAKDEHVALSLLNTIVAGNKDFGGTEDDLKGVLTARNSLIGVSANATFLPESKANILGLAPRLGKLGRHGGTTETIPLLMGSPALDAGSNHEVPAGVRFDQRGAPRIVNGNVDIGAVEAAEPRTTKSDKAP